MMQSTKVLTYFYKYVIVEVGELNIIKFVVSAVVDFLLMQIIMNLK